MGCRLAGGAFGLSPFLSKGDVLRNISRCRARGRTLHGRANIANDWERNECNRSMPSAFESEAGSSRPIRQSQVEISPSRQALASPEDRVLSLRISVDSFLCTGLFGFAGIALGRSFLFLFGGALAGLWAAVDNALMRERREAAVAAGDGIERFQKVLVRAIEISTDAL